MRQPHSTHHVIVNLDIEGIVVQIFVGARKSRRICTIDIARAIPGLGVEELMEKVDVFFFFGASQPDDFVNKTAVAGKVALKTG